MLGLRHAGDFLDPAIGLLDAFADNLAGPITLMPDGSAINVGTAMRVDILRDMRGDEFSFRARDAGLDLSFLGGTGAFHQYHEIFHPPLQHFDDIIRNAQLFYEIRGAWPMLGWLEEFEAMQFISIKHRQIKVHRNPLEHEIAAARKNHSEVF